jgi:hypothetical protein
MLNNEQEPKKKKKKGLLSEKMGLDQGSETFAPPKPPPEVFPGSAEEELNKRSRDGVVSDKIHNKLNNRKGAPRAR